MAEKKDAMRITITGASIAGLLAAAGFAVPCVVGPVVKTDGAEQSVLTYKVSIDNLRNMHNRDQNRTERAIESVESKIDQILINNGKILGLMESIKK